MRKNKASIKKLRINKETLRTLVDKELSTVQGGYVGSYANCSTLVNYKCNGPSQTPTATSSMC